MERSEECKAGTIHRLVDYNPRGLEKWPEKRFAHRIVYPEDWSTAADAVHVVFSF
jgi:hypothetical protein